LYQEKIEFENSARLRAFAKRAPNRKTSNLRSCGGITLAERHLVRKGLSRNGKRRGGEKMKYAQRQGGEMKRGQGERSLLKKGKH